MPYPSDVDVVGGARIATIRVEIGISSVMSHPAVSHSNHRGLVEATAAIGGLALAWRFDTPAGPTMVCLAAAVFALSSLMPRR